MSLVINSYLLLTIPPAHFPSQFNNEDEPQEFQRIFKRHIPVKKNKVSILVEGGMSNIFEERID